MKAEEITQENIRKFVTKFYAKVIKDEIVSPFFIAKLGDDMGSKEWQTHLETIIGFWSFIGLGKPKYSGNLFLPHTTLGELKKETFEQWLSLFAQTVDEVYIEEIAQKFKERTQIIASNFMRNLQII